MINGRRVTAVIVGVLVVTTAGYADMVPVSGVDVGRGASPAVCGPSVLLSTNSSSLFGSPGIANLDLWSINFLPETEADAGQTSAAQHPRVATNGPDSLALCLSALMGLGLCSSVHWVKRLSFGFIPEWYHDGGPHQVGHSHALMLNSVCPVPAYCFIQPVCSAEDAIAQYRMGMVLSLWRKSQCIPTVLGSRAPPDMS